MSKKGHVTRLSRSEEIKLIRKGADKIREELLKAVCEVQGLTLVESIVNPFDFARLNSLLWAHIPFVGKTIQDNIRIIMATTNTTYSDIAKSMGKNVTTVWRTATFNPGGASCNHEVFFELAATLSTDPKVILFADLNLTVRRQMEKLKDLESSN